jgi:hypothetical protein
MPKSRATYIFEFRETAKVRFVHVAGLCCINGLM